MARLLTYAGQVFDPTAYMLYIHILKTCIIIFKFLFNIKINNNMNIYIYTYVYNPFGGPFWVSRCQEIEGDMKEPGGEKGDFLGGCRCGYFLQQNWRFFLRF